MLSLSFSTFRDRWQLFLGAIVTVALAVALCQATLLGLITAATADVPDDLPETEQLALSEGGFVGAAADGVGDGVAPAAGAGPLQAQRGRGDALGGATDVGAMALR